MSKKVTDKSSSQKANQQVGLAYLFNDLSTPYGLFNIKILFIIKRLVDYVL